jgi:hypothetical protein
VTEVTYLNEATTGQYDDEAFDYIGGFGERINEIANTIGISAGAIAGAMVEENHAYLETAWLQDILDQYALSGVDPNTFAEDASIDVAQGVYPLAAIFGNLTEDYLFGQRTHEQWLADYNAVGGDTGHIPSTVDKALHPVYIDLGQANFKMSTAIRLIQEKAKEYPGLGLEKYINDYAQLAQDLVNPLSAVGLGDDRNPNTNVGDNN